MKIVPQRFPMQEEAMVSKDIVTEGKEDENSIKRIWNGTSVTNLNTLNLNVQV